MRQRITFVALTAATLALAACGSDNGNNSNATGSAPARPKVTVDDLSTGTYVVSVGDAGSPTVGKYYAGADGSRLLVTADADDKATRLYRRAASDAWVGVPPSGGDVVVTLLGNGPALAAAPTLASIAGSYMTMLGDGTPAAFNVNADGDITAGGSACKLSGKISAGTLPGTLRLNLTGSGCSGVPAGSTGVVTADPDYAPARFRLIGDNGSQLVDLWAFSQ